LATNLFDVITVSVGSLITTLQAIQSWNSVTRLFSKMATRGEKCRSFDAIASPRPVVFPLSWKVVFFELWQCSSRGVIYPCTFYTVYGLLALTWQNERKWMVTEREFYVTG
jgi:hypothetical protein